MAIPKEQQSAYQRWEMTSFGDNRPSTLSQRIAEQEAAAAAAAIPPSIDMPQIALPSVEELEAMREAARQDGYAQGLEEGRATGHAEGYADGARQGKQQAEHELEQLRAIAATFSDAVNAADETIAGDVLELALRLARGMVRTAFDVRPELILEVVRDAIDRLPALQQPAIMTLNPEDAVLVREGMADELAKGGWRVIEDSHIARGGCKVETASNQIDAQAQARWQRLTHALGANVDWLGQ
jgi:flagellar assembly protein FliH